MEGGCKAARLLSQYIMFNILTKIAMKKKLFVSASAVLAAFAAFSLAGCQKDETGDGSDQDSGTSPVLVITTEDNMDIPAAGGPVSITYRIDNAVPGSTVSASCPETVNWVNGFDTETSGTVSFTVAANTDTESRSALITLTCTWGDGETVSDDVTVIQAAADPEQPVITITTEDNMVIPAEGSDVCAIEYEVDKKGTNGSISVSSPDGSTWLTGFRPMDTGVFFSADGNDTSAERRATVVVTYSYDGNKSVSDHITVIQPVKEDSKPVLSVRDEMPTIPAEGSTEYLYIYVENPVDQSDFVDWTLSCQEDWVHLNISGGSSTAMLMIAVEENTSSEERSSTVTVVYTYNEDESERLTINIVQEGSETTQSKEYNLSATTFSGSYYGNYGDNNEPWFDCTLSGDNPDELSYYFDIYTELTYDVSDCTIQAGTYTYKPEVYSAMVMSDLSAVKIDGSDIDLSSGTLVVKNNEDGTYSFEANLTDELGNTHHVTYTGSAVCQNNS